MKNIIKISALAIISIIITSCGLRMYNSHSSGKDNVAYVIVVKESTYYRYRNISVVIDDQVYPYERVKLVKNKHKALPLKTEPGQHNIKVYEGRALLTEENVLIGLQETKIIVIQ